MPKPIQLDKPCEVCGKNEWWDNRATKKSAKMPDFKCANKECKTDSGYPNGRWLSKDKEPKGGRITGDDTTPEERGEVKPSLHTWGNLSHTYGKLLKAVVHAMEEAGLPADAQAAQAGVATLLIQGDKNHIPYLPVPVKKVTVKDVVKKPEPKVPAHIAADFEQMPEALEGGDDDGLPF